MDAEKLKKSKENLLEQLEEKKKLKKLKKKTEEESDFSDKFGSNKKDGRAGVGSLPGKTNFKTIEGDGGQKIFIMTDEKQKFGKGGRVKGCKLAKRGKGKAYGKNS